MFTVTFSAGMIFALGVFTGFFASVVSLIVVALVAGKKKK